MKYSPENAPDPVQWLATEEEERMAAVEAYHRRKRQRSGNARLHAVIHAVVENQLAEHHPAATAAMERLLADGLNRHEAVHAIGCLVASDLSDMMKMQRRHDAEEYARKLQQLTAETWRRDYGDGDPA